MSYENLIWLLQTALVVFSVASLLWLIDRRRANSYDEYMRKYREHKANVERESRKQL